MTRRDQRRVLGATAPSRDVSASIAFATVRWFPGGQAFESDERRGRSSTSLPSQWCSNEAPGPCPLAAPLSARVVPLALALLLVLSTQSLAQTSLQEPLAVAAGQAASPAEREPSIYDKVWRLASWYENDDNPVVQRVQFSGRLQLDYAGVDADQGSHDEFNVRRLRLGARTALFGDFTLHGEVELNPQEFDPLYVRLTDMYLQWRQDRRLQITVGKHSAPFTLEGATSSKELLTIDRSNLANNMWFPQEYFPGVSLAGQSGPWVYRAAGYSAGQANREFGEFSGGAFSLLVLGYDLGDRLGAEEAVLAANYVRQRPDPDNTFTRSLEHVLSINFSLDAGAWGLGADLSTAAGYLEQSDLLGVMAMTFFDVTDQVQLVSRYTYLESDDVNGVRLARYESQIVAGRGDQYTEGYIGGNYYLYGHELKLQTGIQYAEMQDRANDGGAYSGVAWTAAFRASW